MSEARLLKPLTKDEIQSLPVELRPNYVGTDEEGAYKVDGYGIKRREGERGGPVPKAETRTKPTKRSIDKILEDNKRWAEPAEILLAVANGDKDYFNRRDRSMSLEDIPLFMRVDAANKLMAYAYAKPVIKEEEVAAVEVNNKPKVMVILGSNGRELDKPVEGSYTRDMINKPEVNENE